MSIYGKRQGEVMGGSGRTKQGEHRGLLSGDRPLPTENGEQARKKAFADAEAKRRQAGAQNPSLESPHSRRNKSGGLGGPLYLLMDSGDVLSGGHPDMSGDVERLYMPPEAIKVLGARATAEAIQIEED